MVSRQRISTIPQMLALRYPCGIQSVRRNNGRMGCPRCGTEIVRKPGRGRPPVWCSQECRRAASLERSTAAEPVRVVEVVRVKPVPISEAVEMVLASPRAVENVLNGLADAEIRGAVPGHSRARLAFASARLAGLLNGS